jgi:amino acid adenylation domain-containing protein
MTGDTGGVKPLKPFHPDRYGAPAAAPSLIMEIARTAPETIAIENGGASVDYGELVGRARSTAAALGCLGLVPGSLVAVCLPRSAEQIIAMLAVWLAGGAYLPLDPAWPEGRLANLLADSGCAAVIAAPELGNRIRGQVPRIEVATAVTIGDSAALAVDPDALAYVIYTSGSTGAPKAVEVSHGNLAALIAWHVDAFGVGVGARTSHLAGLGFDASAWEVWPALAAGGTVCLVDGATRLDPAALRDWLVDQRIEVAFAPTALAEPMATMAWPAEAALRTLLTGAERLKARPAPGQPFTLVNNYGPTECTVVATSGIVSAEGTGLPSIGRPIAGTLVHLLDAEWNDVPAGAEGQICIGGVQVARGYRGDSRLTEEKFVTHPTFGRIYCTGDLGAWLPDGELDFRGRMDEQVKVRGHRIEPAEISAALNRLEPVSSSAVILRDGELVAYVVLAGGEAVSENDLRIALAQALPDYMVPARFAAIEALPLTANGKVDIGALPDPASSPMGEAPTHRGPSSPTERRLLDILVEVLGRSDIGVEDDFFLLGGHSLLGTQLVIRARDAFGVELTLFHLFEGRTVARLAATIERLAIELIETMSDEEIRRMVG